MTQTNFQAVQKLATDLDLQINQLQNSAGVLSDEDQAALDRIEHTSKQLVQAVDVLNKPDQESTRHKEAVEQDKQVRPGETPEQHAARMAHSYPEHAPVPAAAPLPFQGHSTKKGK